MMRYQVLILSFLICATSCSDTTHHTWSPESTLQLYEEVAYTDKEVMEVEEAESSTAQPSSQKIIKTATLRYETQDLVKAREEVLAVIKRFDGYVQNDNSGKDHNRIYQRITVRIPTKNFDKALQNMSEDISYFEERTISQQDVTEEFVDLNARLKAKRALEDRYLALLARATSVKEMLEIERELSKIREEIEAKEGRLKYLSSQVSMSTLYIHFYKITTDQGITQSYGSKIINAFKGGWNGISVFFLRLLHLWPFLILLGIGAFFIHRWKGKKKK